MLTAKELREYLADAPDNARIILNVYDEVEAEPFGGYSHNEDVLNSAADDVMVSDDETRVYISSFIAHTETATQNGWTLEQGES